MKKRIPVGIMIMTMTAAAAMPVSAAATDKDMTIRYTEPNAWMVSIPQTTINSDTDVEKSLEVTQINIEPGKKLQVKIGQNNGQDIIDGVVILNRTDNKAAVKTNVSMDKEGKNKVSTDSVIAEFQAEETVPTYGGSIFFSAVYADAGEVKAGDYSGTMTYKMEVADIN
ncbi:hypothetical protein [Blautia marasmi]|uniref:hypothetical protein n=1 Tax=Blautia marasmi TaxID=1917868 RepID=UPI000CF220C5|nr:hypothetical protein [Blautia marasmi]